MSLRMIALAAALGLATVAHAAPQATTPAAAKAMNYDCTKTGNKNKAACKNVTPAAVAAKPAAMAPAAAKAPAKAMNYDCTKAGNKTKAVCKNVAVPVAPTAMAPAKPAMAAASAAKPMTAAPVAKPMTVKAPKAAKPVNPNLVAATLKNGKVVHYDCAKTGNVEKKACGAK